MSATTARPRPVVCRSIDNDHAMGVFYGDNPFTYSFPLILLEISFTLIIIRVLRFLLKPLHQPRIVSEVLGGIIVGPSFLGRSEKFKGFLFPENSDFIVKNIGVMGFIYFLFISGIKMDMKLVTKSSKKHIWVAIASVIMPLFILHFAGFIIRGPVGTILSTPSSIIAVASTFSITSFPSLFPVLKELNLLSSDIGRIALSTAIISEGIGINALFAFETIKQGEINGRKGGWFVLTAVSVLLFFIIIRRVLTWFVTRSQGGKPIEQGVIVIIILGALATGFMTDMFGLAIGNGPLLFGLIIPDGPPLGSLIVEKTETFATEILMPFSFAFIGMYIDIFNLTFDWPSVKPLMAMAMLGYGTKFVATLFTSLYLNIPLRESLALSLLLNVKGQVELVLFMHWLGKGFIRPFGYTCLVMLTVLTTGLMAPLIVFLYDSTDRFTLNNRRTIQHTPPGEDLGVMLTIEEQDEVAGLVTLLEASNPSAATPLSVTVLCLIELIGRATPVFIDHHRQRIVPPQYASCLSIHNAIRLYKECRASHVKVHSYTAVTFRRTVYQDICELAMFNQTTLIILIFDVRSSSARLPFTLRTARTVIIENLNNREGFEAAGRLRLGVGSVDMFVLANAPCSVGIFVDKGHFAMNPLDWANSFSASGGRRIAVLFLGGADAREALALADRMLGNPAVHLYVFRFLASSAEGHDEIERKLDDGIVKWFWVKNEANERMIYREVTVRNGTETVATIQVINEEPFDLWVVGREQGINPVLLKGLSELTRNHPQLGLIGEYVAAPDFRGNASVLVIQQQILRQQDSPATTLVSQRRVRS